MTVNGPDGRVWRIARRPQRDGLVGHLLPGPWVVEAATDDEVRRWATVSRRAARRRCGDVAMALRTGADGPAGELPPDVAPPSGGPERREADQDDADTT